MKELPVRKQIRLNGYDYSQAGYYYITICVNNRHEMLGRIVGAASCRPLMELSDYGKIVRTWIDKIPAKYPYVKIDKQIIMPNHIHMILSMRKENANANLGRQNANLGRQNAAPTVSISRVIGYFKYQTTKEIDIPGFWQRSFHDRIIRDEDEYNRIWQYIDENPARWREDDDFIEDQPSAYAL
jgi:REP element-mobilizing transposase RayT